MRTDVDAIEDLLDRDLPPLKKRGEERFVLCRADQDYVERTWFAAPTLPQDRPESPEWVPPPGLVCSARLG